MEHRWFRGIIAISAKGLSNEGAVMRISTLRCWFAALICAVVLGNAPAHADVLDTIKGRGTLIVGGKGDYKPFGFRESDGKIVGFAVDLAQEVADRLGVKLEIVPTTAANMLQFLQQEKVDVIIAAMNDTPERRKIVSIVDPGYFASGANVMIQKAAKVASWEDLKGKKICAIQGAFYNKPVQEKYGADLIAFPTTAAAYSALKGGNCVGIVYDDGNLAVQLQDPEWADYEMTLASILEQPVVAAVRPGDERLNKMLSEMVIGWHKSGRILELEKKWFGRNSSWVVATHDKYK
jgi:polar amino acid transport system substrate-binding protein